MTPEELGLNAEEIAHLDTLSPPERHALLDQMHQLHASVESFKGRAAEASRVLNDLNETLASQRPLQQTDEQHAALTDFMMLHALTSEGLQALANGDTERSQELLKMTAAYRRPVYPKVIRRPPPEDTEDSDG